MIPDSLACEQQTYWERSDDRKYDCSSQSNDSWGTSMSSIIPKIREISVASQMERSVLVRSHRKYSGPPLEVIHLDRSLHASRFICLDGELQPRAGEKNAGSRYPNK